MALGIPIVTTFDNKGVKGAIREFQNLEGTTKKMDFAIRKATAPAAAALGVLGGAALKAAKMAGDLNETQSATNVLFGESSKVITAFSKRAAKELGLSQIAAMEAAQTFGGLGRAAGKQGTELANFAQQMTKLTADMASFKNTTPEDAIQAVGAALRGEMEPIRRYNVLLDDATLRNRALQMGLIDSVKTALTPANKTLAAQAEILAQTSHMQDDFIRTSGGAAGQQKILKAQLDNVVRSIGQAFIPILETLLPLLSRMAGFVERNSGLFVIFGLAIAGFASAILAARGAMIAWNAVAVITKALNWALATSFTAVQVATGVGIATAIAGAAAFVMIKAKMDKAKGSADAYADALAGLNGKQALVVQSQAELDKFVGPVLTRDFKKLTGTVTETNTEVDKASKAKLKAAAAAKKLAQAVKSAKEAVGRQFAEALEAANLKLEEAQNKFNDFRSSVSGVFTGALNFSKAYESGAETGQGFISGLTSQADKIKKFGELTNRLIAAELSEQALGLVLDAGVDAGTAIAEELLSGAGNILEANKLVADVQTMADKVGLNSANSFYKAGVDAGTAFVNGIQAKIDMYTPMLNVAGLTVAQIQNIGTSFNNAPAPASNPYSGVLDLSGIMSGIPFMAQGGIIQASPSGTLALIGEGGQDEAVIPLNRLGNMGSTNVTINVQGGDPNAVVDALRRYMRQNGSVPITVSTP